MAAAAPAPTSSSPSLPGQDQQLAQQLSEHDGVQLLPQAQPAQPPAPSQVRLQGGGQDSHSLQGSVGQQVSAGGDSADSRGAGARRISGSWLLGSLGVLTQAFKRNATQVRWWLGSIASNADHILGPPSHLANLCARMAVASLPQAKQASAPGAFLTQQGLVEADLLSLQQQQAADLRRIAAATAARQAGAPEPPSQLLAPAAHSSGAAGHSSGGLKLGQGAARQERPSASAWNAKPSAAAPAQPAAAGAAPSAASAGQEPASTDAVVPSQALEPPDATTAGPQSPPRPTAGLGLWSGESPGVPADASPSNSGGSEPAGLPSMKRQQQGQYPTASVGSQPARTPKADHHHQQQQQGQQERRLSGGFLDILARISSPQLPSKPASPAAPATALPSPSSAAVAAPPVAAAPAPEAAAEEPEGHAATAAGEVVAAAQPDNAAHGPTSAPEQVGASGLVTRPSGGWHACVCRRGRLGCCWHTPWPARFLMPCTRAGRRCGHGRCS